jgi:hypothetical protein
MIIFHRKQLVGTGFHPFLLLLPVALRTMAVAAGVILIMHMGAIRVIALIIMITHNGSAAIAQLREYARCKSVLTPLQIA